jgi:4-diphosphocytidyl-2-C-methyl-D-erythritol kinase
MLTIKAPAKINLTLEVLGKRPDGYHEIKSVVQTVNLCDTLYLEAADDVIYESDLPGWSAEKSVIKKIADALRAGSGSRGARVRIEKRIPMLAGLGGDSSDAAALLEGLNKLWELDLPAAKLKEITAGAGSDVSFFLQGGTALMEGRGEKIKRLPAPPEMWVVLIFPDVPNAPFKTGRMYAALQKEHFTDGAITQNMVKSLHNNRFDTTALFNTFENVAFDVFPGLKVSQEHLLKLGAARVHLAGSGPTLFVIFEDKEKARDFHARCKGQGMKAYLAETL